MHAANLSIQPVRLADVGVLYELICELAAYENLSGAVTAREKDIREALFGEPPVIEAILARGAMGVVGFASFYMTFSTFRGKPGLYVEDLFVREVARGKGVGRALMEHLSQVATGRGCDRMTWAVLDWNSPAQGFYRSLGATDTSEWVPYGVSGEALGRLARPRCTERA